MTKAYSPKEFSERLAVAGKRLHPEVSRVLNKAAMIIRDDWRAQAARKNPRHAKTYPHSINASWAKVSGSEIAATVSPTRGRQAKLGTILEYGGPHNAPQLSHVEAAARESDTLLKWLRKVAEECI